VYVEYSNELWNFQFSQADGQPEGGVAEAIAGDTTLTKGQRARRRCSTPVPASASRTGRATTASASARCRSPGSFGGLRLAALNKQVRVVYATQFANPGVAEQVLKNIATYRATPSSLLYGVRRPPTSIFRTTVGSETGSRRTDTAEPGSSLRTDDQPDVRRGVKENGVFVRRAYTGGNFTGASHKALADYYGLKSLAYEGGPDLGQSAANGAAKIAANRDPAMGELVKSEVGQWLDAATTSSCISACPLPGTATATGD
jgi:hypothetical protein